MPDTPDIPLRNSDDENVSLSPRLIASIEDGSISSFDLYNALGAQIKGEDLRGQPIYEKMVEYDLLVDGESGLSLASIRGIMWALQNTKPLVPRRGPQVDSGSAHGTGMADDAREDRAGLTHDGDWDHGLLLDEVAEIAESTPPEVLQDHVRRFARAVVDGDLTAADLQRAVDAYYSQGDLRSDRRYAVLVRHGVLREGEGRMRPAAVRPAQIAISRL